MKRIIAAALSILVGAFGYTIVDSAIEARVATLESEVVELREEVSKYHPQSSWFTTTPNSTNRTTGYYTTSTTGYRTTTTRMTTTTTASWSPMTGTNSTIMVGSYLIEGSNSMHKFFLRKWSNGKVYYVSPQEYGNQGVSNEAEMSRLLESMYIPTKLRAGITDPPDGRLETTVANNGITEPIYNGTPATTTALTYDEHFLYISESTAQVTSILEEVSYSYSYDKDYSQVSSAYGREIVKVKVKCRGYTDSSLAGKKVVFSVYWRGNSRPDTIINNTIKADGTFEYEAVYLSTYPLYNHNATYSLTSISVS